MAVRTGTPTVIASSSIDSQSKDQDLSLKEVCYLELYKEQGAAMGPAALILPRSIAGPPEARTD